MSDQPVRDGQAAPAQDGPLPSGGSLSDGRAQDDLPQDALTPSVGHVAVGLPSVLPPDELDAFDELEHAPELDASRESPSPQGAAVAREAMVELNALLGQGTHYAGKLWFEGRVRVEGRFEGEIRGDVLVVGAGADVEGAIEVGVCIVTGGKVRGDIRARDAIELHAPAVVVGDLHAPNVFIDRGVQFEGSCKMAPLDAEETPDPAPSDAVRAVEPVTPGDAPEGGAAASDDGERL